MRNKNLICPACGSKNLTRSEKENSDQLTLGSKFLFQDISYKCNVCGEEGDFFGEADKNYLYAKKVAEHIFVKNTIENLNNLGISMAFFERAFELPPRTLTRWKTGDFSSASLALLRVAKVYPWITEVAEHRFDYIYAKGTIAREEIIFEQESNYLSTKSGGSISDICSMGNVQ